MALFSSRAVGYRASLPFLAGDPVRHDERRELGREQRVGLCSNRELPQGSGESGAYGKQLRLVSFSPPFLFSKELKAESFYSCACPIGKGNAVCRTQNPVTPAEPSSPLSSLLCFFFAFFIFSPNAAKLQCFPVPSLSLLLFCALLFLPRSTSPSQCCYVPFFCPGVSSPTAFPLSRVSRPEKRARAGVPDSLAWRVFFFALFLCCSRATCVRKHGSKRGKGQKEMQPHCCR